MDNVENIKPSGVWIAEKLNDAPDEGPITVPQPLKDVYFSANNKIIQDLICDEVRYHSLPAYCVYESSPQAIWMRRALLNWLREVCEHRHTEPEVLAHTAQLIDRVVHIIPTDKREYQLVGAACFLISSKLKETIPVSVERMVQYSDFSVTKQDLLNKEVTIAVSLKWDFTSISPIDFIHPTTNFLQYLPEMCQLLRQSAVQIFMNVLHVEGINFHLPGYTAAACLLYALQLTVAPDLGNLTISSAARIQHLLGLEARKLREAFNFLTSLFKPGTVELSDYVISVDMGPPSEPLAETQHFIDPPPETSTPSTSGSHLSSSSVCSATSSSTGMSNQKQIMTPEDQRQKISPCSASKNVSSAGEPLNRDLPLSLSTVGVRASDRVEYWSVHEWTPTDIREVEIV